MALLAFRGVRSVNSIISSEQKVLLRGLALLGFVGFLLLGIGFLISGYAASAPFLKSSLAKTLITTRSKLTIFSSFSLILVGALLVHFSMSSMAKESGWHVLGDGMSGWTAYVIIAGGFFTIGLGFKSIATFTGMVSKSIIFYSMVDSILALVLLFLAGGRIYSPLFALGRLKGGRWIAPLGRYGTILGAVLLPVGFGGIIAGIVFIILGIALLVKASSLPVKSK